MSHCCKPNGKAERDAAALMLERIEGGHPVTVGADKGYDTHGFVADARSLRVTPHVAQNTKRNGGSAIDERTTRHAGYAIGQRKRKAIEECFGWLQTIALLRQVRHRGILKVGWIFTFGAAVYNLVRMRKLLPAVQAAQLRGHLCPVAAQADRGRSHGAKVGDYPANNGR